MRKLGIVAAVATALVAMTSATLAASPHVVGSLNVSPDGNVVTVTGKIAGLGNGYTGMGLSGEATATFDVQCANPQGKIAPGQQGATGDLEGSGSIDSVESNGTYSFHITFTINLSPAKAFGCPNNQWTATAQNIRGFEVTSLTLDDGTNIRL